MPANPRPRAFTIVELLVVVAIIAILSGIVVTAVFKGVQSSKKTKEMNRIRQIHLAWTIYGNNNNDAAMPGFVDPGTQTAWKLRSRLQSGSDVPQELAQTYTWRLAGYLGYNLDPVLGYREDYTRDLDSSDYLPPDNPVAPPASILPGLGSPGAGAAYQPSFGYNAYYLGGWWTTVGGSPEMTFVDGTFLDNGQTVRGRLVSRSISSVSRPSEVIAFASSTYYGVGQHGEPEPLSPGAAWVTPPQLGSQSMWGFGGATFQGIDAGAPAPSAQVPPASGKQGALGAYEVYVEGAAVPLRRFGEQVVICNVDGSTDAVGLDQLQNMRRWISAATARDFTHTDN